MKRIRHITKKITIYIFISIKLIFIFLKQMKRKEYFLKKEK